MSDLPWYEREAMRLLARWPARPAVPRQDGTRERRDALRRYVHEGRDEMLTLLGADEFLCDVEGAPFFTGVMADLAGRYNLYGEMIGIPPI